MDKGKIRKWKTLGSKIVFDHRWYKVCQEAVEVAPGKVYDDYFMGIFPNIVLIVAITKDKEILFVRQYKHGAGEILLEVPAGYIDNKETPLKAAKRELLEETGFASKEWTELGFYYSNPTKERGNGIYIYLAENAKSVSKSKTDEMENIEVRLIGIKDVVKMIKENKIRVAGSVMAILLSLFFSKKEPRAILTAQG